MTSGIAAFAALLGAGQSPIVATYAPIGLVALTVVMLEFRFPERLDWRPRWSDIKTDALFMLVVQVLVPRVLAASCALIIADQVHSRAPSHWWPHAAPLAAQILAMVLVVDFMRYWLHRACHHFTPLWRLHQVHHSPDGLYTLNVGRFHPLEKALHFCCDTVPFLLLGLAPEVLAGYFVVYSLNGFFQHSNLRLRYGWLNHLVGSAQTHRWHHARDPKLAACNFGSTTLIWDVLFGTWQLPGSAPLETGIPDRSFPKSFWAQMWAPFRSPRFSLKARIADALVGLQLRRLSVVSGVRIATTTKDPMVVQRALLSSILAANRQTRFGRQHDFASIDSHQRFVAQVPVRDYEALRPFIDAEIEGNAAALTADTVVQYLRTSGTTGRPKDVPLTRRHLNALRRLQHTAVALQYRLCPEGFAGGILALTSPGQEGTLRNGKPFGSASGIVAGGTPAPVLAKFVIPAAVLTITDSQLKYLLVLRLALARQDLSYIGTANSTTLLALIKLYREHQDALIADLRQGTFFLHDRLSAPLRAAIQSRLRADPRRADELAAKQSDPEGIRIADLWPELRVVTTWTCASAGIAVGVLRKELSPRTRVLELGYTASEFRGTITLGRHAGTGLPTFDTHFFEFVERDSWDRDEPVFLTLDQIRKGADYYVIVTTPSGLYRYFINDLVRVRGFLNNTPLLQFVQKGKGVTNITGEKLYEAQVLEAVRTTLAGVGRCARYVMMLADEEIRRYQLYVELGDGAAPPASWLAQSVDTRLGELNVEYAAKRESDRLGPLTATWLATGTGEAFKQFSVQQGQREGQFKTVAIACRKDFAFDLDAHAANVARAADGTELKR